jgi:hypothetical protein
MFSQAARLGIGQRPGWRIFTVSETACVLRAWLKQPGIKSKALVLNAFIPPFFVANPL